MTGGPPLGAGATQLTVACASPLVAVAAVGAAGLAAGTMRLLAALGGLVPMVLVAVTLNLYPVPLVRPVTVAVVWLAVTVLVMPPGVEVMV